MGGGGGGLLSLLLQRWSDLNTVKNDFKNSNDIN